MGAEISKEISALLVRRAGLSESIKGLKSNIADIDNELAGLVSEDFQRQRLKEGKDFGQITLKIGNFKVTQTVPETVTWDQATLHQLADKIRQGMDKPEEWMDMKWDIPESRFKAWSKKMQAFFAPARTAKPGKTKYEFKLPKGA